MPASLYLIKRQGARSSGSVERQAICRVCAAVSRSVPRSMSQSLPRHSADHLTCTSEYEPIVAARAVAARAVTARARSRIAKAEPTIVRVCSCVLSLACCSLAVHTLCMAWARTTAAATAAAPIIAVCATITITSRAQT